MGGKRKRILITGGAGFIGSRLAALWSNDADVTVLDNFHPQAHDGNPDNRNRLAEAGVSILTADICNPAAVDDAVRQSDPHIVYHLAAETGTGQSFDEPTRYNKVNVMGTTHLIESIRRFGSSVERVILAGSRSVYGEGACVNAAGDPTPALERTGEDMQAGDFTPKCAKGTNLTPVATDADCIAAPASIYASTKLMQEYLLAQAFWGTDVKVGILRLQNVYGPGQSLNNPYTGVLSIFARQIMENKTLDIYEDGEITRDFVLVDDVVAAFRAMGLVDKMPQEIVDIGSGEAATILDVAKTLLSLLGESPEKFRITGAFRPGDIRYAVADISKAKMLLDWAPSHNLEDGLSALVEWSKRNLEAA